jgi:hypothetical protein
MVASAFQSARKCAPQCWPRGFVCGSGRVWARGRLRRSGTAPTVPLPLNPTQLRILEDNGNGNLREVLRLAGLNVTPIMLTPSMHALSMCALSTQHSALA